MDLINVFGKEWYYGMEAGRRVHPHHPNVVFTNDCVVKYNSENGETVEFRTRKLDKPITTRHWDGKDYVSNYAVGGICSCDAYSYGTFSIKCKLPKGSGQHAAFWLSGDKTWPPEIDCFETCNTLKAKTMAWPHIFQIFKNGYATELLKWTSIMPARRIQPNIHWDTDKNDKCTSAFNTPFNFFNNPYDEFNEYRILWMPDLIKIIYNGNPVMECRDESILEWFNKSPLMHVILDNNYIQSVEDCKKDVKTGYTKTPFVVYGFEYRPL
jgi:beta-glucanase (GH16 family)